MVKSKKKLSWANNVARMEEYSSFKILTDKPTGKRLLGRPWNRREDNIIMDLKDIGINVTDYQKQFK